MNNPLELLDVLGESGRTPARTASVFEMAPMSLRNLMLPPAANGHPENLNRELLASLFAIPQSVVLICSEPNPVRLAQLTLGLGAFVRDDTDLTLLVVVDDDASNSSASEKLRQTWRAALDSEPVARRLTLYRLFAEKKRLRILFRSSAERGESNVLRLHLAESPAIALLYDTAGTQVELMWKMLLTFDTREDVAVELRWSFGDPLQRVEQLRSALTKIADEPSADPQAEMTLSELIAALPLPPLPWDETFDLQTDTGVRLFPHQRTAVDAWFENGRHGIFKMCTGSGKTIAALAAVLESARKATEAGGKPLPVIVSVPTRVLADQWCREIERFGFSQPLKAYNAKQTWHPKLRAMLRASNGALPNFVVSTYCTFSNEAFVAILEQLDQQGQRCLWIADEMHNLASTRLLDQMEKLGSYFTERIGLSATPEIENEGAKTRRLFQFFEDGRQTTCGHYELADGIRDGVLCRYRYYPFPQYLQPENSEKFMAILNALEQQEASGRIDINLYRQKREIVRTSGVQVEAFRRLLQNFLRDGKQTLRHTLIYCPPGYGTSGSELDASASDDAADERDEDRLLTEVVQILRSHDITVGSIIGETPQHERNDILRDFRSGDIQVLCAVACLDEGVDVPDIRRAIVLYSVNREKQFIQRRGRILRRHPADTGKIAEIHDVLILPQGSTLPPSRADELLKREMRRYHHFAGLSENRTEADGFLQLALHGAAQPAAATVQI